MTNQHGLRTMNFSILIVRPKGEFFLWLDEISRKRHINRDEIYFPEEDGVWIIPATGTFSDEKAMNEYMEQLKPLIVERELGKFGLMPEEVPESWTAALCDQFFLIELRDNATIAKEFATAAPQE